MLLCRTLRDMNLSKLVFDDISLFKALLKDIFPMQFEGNKEKFPTKVYKEVAESVQKLVKEKNLVDKSQWILKVIQLYETRVV